MHRFKYTPLGAPGGFKQRYHHGQIGAKPENEHDLNTKIRKMAEPRPGASTLYLYQRASRACGFGYANSQRQVARISLRVYPSREGIVVNPRDVSGRATLARALDCLVAGEPEGAMDLLACRMLCVEESVRNSGKWEKAALWECREQVINGLGR